MVIVKEVMVVKVVKSANILKLEDVWSMVDCRG